MNYIPTSKSVGPAVVEPTKTASSINDVKLVGLLQQQQPLVVPQGGCMKKKKKSVLSKNKCDDDHHDYRDDDSTSLQQPVPPPMMMKKKKVWFSKVELIEFPIILGDNPTPNDGFPITIGWIPQQRTDLIEIDYYEMFFHQRRRSGMDLFLDASTRAELVIKGGASISKVPFIDWPMYFRTHQNLKTKNNNENNNKKTMTTSTATSNNKKSTNKRKGPSRQRNSKMRLADEHNLLTTLHHATMI